jgi:hypothetical protein
MADDRPAPDYEAHQKAEVIRYLTAWDAGEELGEPEFDRCLTLNELAGFLVGIFQRR